MEKFKSTVKVSYYATNSQLKLTQNNFLEYLQDVAIEHSNSLGYSIDKLEKEGYGWVLTNWHVLVKEYPKYEDQLIIKTWSSACKRLQAERSFSVENSKGEEVALATSRWVFMDFSRRRPARIPQEMEDDYYSGIESAIENEKFLMAKKEEREPDYQYSANVRRSETDSNGHTNNTTYVAWAMDLVPDAIYNEKNNFDISVIYRKECYKGSLVTAKAYISEENGITQINTYFLDGNDEDIVFCQVVSLWK